MQIAIDLESILAIRAIFTRCGSHMSAVSCQLSSVRTGGLVARTSSYLYVGRYFRVERGGRGQVERRIRTNSMEGYEYNQDLLVEDACHT